MAPPTKIMDTIKRLKPQVKPVQTSVANTIYVDTDTEEIKVGTGSSGSTERVLLTTANPTPDPLLLADGTATAPTYSFAADADNGLYRIGTNNLGVAAGGSEALRIDASLGIRIAPTWNLLIPNSQVLQNNAIAAERGFHRWATNVWEIGTEANGGTGRNMRFITPSNQGIRISVNGNSSDLLQITATGIEMFGAGVYGGVEQTAPAAPDANGYRIFAQDSGAGKTQLCVLFASGAAQVIAEEP